MYTYSAPVRCFGVQSRTKANGRYFSVRSFSDESCVHVTFLEGDRNVLGCHLRSCILPSQAMSSDSGIVNPQSGNTQLEHEFRDVLRARYRNR